MNIKNFMKVCSTMVALGVALGGCDTEGEERLGLDRPMEEADRIVGGSNTDITTVPGIGRKRSPTSRTIPTSQP